AILSGPYHEARVERAPADGKGRVAERVHGGRHRSPSSHEVHQLDRVPRSHPDVSQRGPADDGAVVFHHDGARVELERREQLEQRHAPGHRAALPVHRDVDRIVHCVSSCTMLRAVVRGSAASHSARIAATPYTPAARSSGSRSGVTPPIAITGRPSPTTPATDPGPSGARPGEGWVAVGNTGPNKR